MGKDQKVSSGLKPELHFLFDQFSPPVSLKVSSGASSFATEGHIGRQFREKRDTRVSTSQTRVTQLTRIGFGQEIGEISRILPGKYGKRREVQGPGMFKWYDEQRSWVLPTSREFSGTIAIALSFVVLAYFLHPAVEKAYQRVRAYRGWRAIEANKTVEVTTYPLVSEICGGRGRWDAARIVAIVLAVFSLVSWGLELQMDLAHINDDVTDLFLRPPPVWKKPNETGDAWYVIPPGELKNVEGYVHNMFGDFPTGTANARYKADNNEKIINGKVRIASWDTNVERVKNKLFYDDNGDGTGRVKNTDCSSDEVTEDLYVDGDSEPWGNVVDCKNGPQRVNGENGSISHVVKLTSRRGDVYFIVEESSTYPSFLYTIWKVQSDMDGSAELFYEFHISSSVRLAEAVITEMVHADRESRVPTGRRSFALVRVFSETNTEYDIALEDRASPFGEHPTGEMPEDISLSTIESIEEGIKLNTTALFCAVWLLALALVGIVWSILLRSSIDMDIYNRDELIRAVTMTGSEDGVDHLSMMRIFVTKAEGGKLSVAITDDEFHQRNCLHRCRKQREVVAINDPMPKDPSHHSHESGGPVVQKRPRTVWLEGVRMGKGRAYPGRRGNYRYPTSIALSASPTPSGAWSIAGTPVHHVASPADVPPRIRQFPGVGPALFNSVSALGNCEKTDGDIEIVMAGSNEKLNEGNPCDETGSSPRRCESHRTEILYQQDLQSLAESTTTLRDPSLTTVGQIKSAFGRSEILPTDRGEEVTDNLNDYIEAGVAETE